jgi:DNA-binding MarR family transcriptional regulator
VPLTKVKATRVRLATADYAELAAFRRALREFLRFSEDAAAPAGLSGRQYQAMLFLRGRERVRRVSIEDLAQELLIKHNSAVGLADRLVREGLAARRRATDDRRRVELALTPLGRQVLARLASMHRVELRRIGPGLRRFFGRMSTPPKGD